MPIHNIEPDGPQDVEIDIPDHAVRLVVPGDLILLLQSLSDLLETSQTRPEASRNWADGIDDEDAISRLRPLVNSLIDYAATRDGGSVCSSCASLHRARDNDDRATLFIDRDGRIKTIGDNAVEILGFNVGESIKDMLLEPLPILLGQAERLTAAFRSEIFGRDGRRRLVNIRFGIEKSADVAGLRLSLCSVLFPAAAEDYLRNTLSLTDAEIAILSLSIQRHTIDEIARKRGNSVNTIRTHTKNITDKFGCRHFSDVIVRALELIVHS